MGSYPSCIVPLAEAALAGDGLVGGKAASLGSLIQAGFRVPRGFCITTLAYEQFIAEAGLSRHVAMELGRKPLDAMRWEELWDAALRIRSTFLQTGIPETIAVQIRQALADHVGDSAVAVRSSAPGRTRSSGPLPGSTSPSSGCMATAPSSMRCGRSGPRCGRMLRCSIDASCRSTRTKAVWRYSSRLWNWRIARAWPSIATRAVRTPTVP